MSFVLKVVVVFVMLYSGMAAAQDSNLDTFFSGMQKFGVMLTFKRNSSPSVLNEVFDLQNMTDLIPTFKQMKLLNPDISQTAINMMPVSINGVVAIELTAGTIQEIYKFSKPVDLMRVNAYMRVADEYGRPKYHPLFSCKFSRALYQKINWDHFNTENFPKVAPSFKYASWYTSKVQAETQ